MPGQARQPRGALSGAERHGGAEARLPDPRRRPRRGRRAPRAAARAGRRPSGGGARASRCSRATRRRRPAWRTALAAMTLAIGRRVIVVDGVERWRQADVERAPRAGDRADAARDDGRAVRARGGAREGAGGAARGGQARPAGQVVAQMTVKPWELPKWAREQAARMGLSLDMAAAKALVAQVGERQQRLLRELEKLALEGDADAGSSAARARRRRGAGDRGAARRTRPSGARTRWPTRSWAATRARGDARPTCACASRASACRA